MIHFNFMIDEYGEVTLMAVMVNEPPVEIGVYDDIEDAEAAAEAFAEQYQKHLH